MSAWTRLGLERTRDVAEIRRAYARQLKAIDVDADPDAFIALRKALNAALAHAAGRSEELGYTAEPDDDAEPHAAPSDYPDGEAAGVVVRPAEEAGPENAPGEAYPGPPPDLFARIDELLQLPPDAATDEALVRAAEALIAHPSLERIDVADAVEDWLAQRIMATMPRSDPLLVVAAQAFGWTERAGDWRAPPLLDWFMSRLRDHEFERILVAHRPRFAPVIDLLRWGEVPPAPATVRRLAPDVRDFADFAGAYHPTSIQCCKPEMRDWWNDYFEGRSFWGRQYDSIRRAFRAKRSIQSVFATERPAIDSWEIIGIIFLPWLKIWPWLRSTSVPLVRTALIAWTGLWSVAVIAWLASLEPPPGLKGPIYGLPETVPASTRYHSPEADMDPMLRHLSSGRRDLEALGRSNPDVHGKIVSLWEQGQRLGRSKSAIVHEAAEILDESYRAAVRGGDFETQWAYWRLFGDKLRWLWNSSSSGQRECVRLIDGDESLQTEFPRDLTDRERGLITELLFRPTRLAPLRSPAHPVSVSEELLSVTVPRTFLRRDRLVMALNGEGTSLARCEAYIQLIATALNAPREEAEPFFRELSLRL